MQQEVIILGCKPYDFTDDTGKRVSGASAWVIPSKVATDGKSNGFLPAKYSVPADQMQQLVQAKLPAIATLNLSFDLQSNRAKFDSFSNLSPVDFVI